MTLPCLWMFLSGGCCQDKTHDPVLLSQYLHTTPSAVAVLSGCILYRKLLSKQLWYSILIAGRMWPIHPVSRTGCHRAEEEFGEGVGSIHTCLFSRIYSSWLYHARASSPTFGLECLRCPGPRAHTSTSRSNLFSMSPWRLWEAPKNTMERNRWAHVCCKDIYCIFTENNDIKDLLFIFIQRG